MNLTTLIALYGVFLSTIAIGWKIYNNFQDRPKIRVIAKFGFMTGDNSKKTSLFIKAINKGRRHVTLSSVGIRLNNKQNLINIKTISLPHELNEGKSHSEWFELKELKDKNCLFAWYRDETGKLYKSKSIRKKIDNYFNSKKNKNTN